jgi:hypothetical protein
MNKGLVSLRHLALFDAEARVWDSLDESTREQVLNGLGLLLLGHLQQTAPSLPQEQLLTKGTHE